MAGQSVTVPPATSSAPPKALPPVPPSRRVRAAALAALSRIGGQGHVGQGGRSAGDVEPAAEPVAAAPPSTFLCHRYTPEPPRAWLFRTVVPPSNVSEPPTKCHRRLRSDVGGSEVAGSPPWAMLFCTVTPFRIRAPWLSDAPRRRPTSPEPDANPPCSVMFSQRQRCPGRHVEQAESSAFPRPCSARWCRRCRRWSGCRWRQSPAARCRRSWCCSRPSGRRAKLSGPSA